MTPNETEALLAEERAPAQAEVDAWNAVHPVGIHVAVTTTAFQGLAVTTSAAYVLSGPPGYGHAEWKTPPAAVVDIEAPPGNLRGWVKLSALQVAQSLPDERAPLPDLGVMWPKCPSREDGGTCEEEAGRPDMCRFGSHRAWEA